MLWLFWHYFCGLLWLEAIANFSDQLAYTELLLLLCHRSVLPQLRSLPVPSTASDKCNGTDHRSE